MEPDGTTCTADGNPCTVDQFADPLNTTTYALCIYGGTSAALFGGAEVPPSTSLWTVQGQDTLNGSG
jgi:hypothetical protein